MLETTLDVVRDVISGIRHRIKSPWSSAFITSWLIFNWKPVYYIFSSDESSIDKIAHIETVFSDPYITIFYPLLSSLIYCIVYPIVLNVTSYFWLASQKLSNHIHIQLLNTTTYMTRAEGDEYLKQINDLTEKNEFLKKEAVESNRIILEENNQLRVRLSNAELDDPSILSGATKATPLPSIEESRSILEMKSELLHTESGRFHLRKFLANKLKLEQDYEPHQQDLNLNFEIIRQCIECHPEEWFSKAITIENRQSQQLKVNGELRRLEQFGLLKTKGVDEKRLSATLSDRAQEELIKLIKEIK
jgi:hypothetical protein